MPPSAQTCPNKAAMRSYLDETCTATDRTHIENHLETCELCQELLETLSGHPAWERVLPQDGQVAVDTATQIETDGASLQGPVACPSIEGYSGLVELGRGGMGVVYRATHDRLNRPVALKILTSSSVSRPERWLRFQTEAKAIARLQHPNIIQIFDSGECDGVPFVAQELADDGSLADQLADGPMAPTQACSIVRDLAKAVAHAHEREVVHRDIKPSNILRSEKRYKLADFGLAKIVDVESLLTETSDVIGTPVYMSPEQAAGSGQLGKASDIYSMGVVLYELICGVVPLRGASAVETLRLIVEQEPVRPRQLVPSVPRDLETICLTCLAKEPHRRYESTEALLGDLERFEQGVPILAKPVGPLQRIWKWAKRKPALATLTTVSCLLALTLLGVWASYTHRVSTLNANLEGYTTQLEHEKSETAAQMEITDAVNKFFIEDLLMHASAEYQQDQMRKEGGQNFSPDPPISWLVDRAAERLDRNTVAGLYQGKPKLQAALARAIGMTYDDLGRFEEARQYFALAIDLQKDAGITAKDKDLLDTWNSMALNFITVGRYDEAIERLQWVLEQWRPDMGGEFRAGVQHSLAGAYMLRANTNSADRNSDRKKALHYAELAAAGHKSQFGANSEEHLICLATLGQCLDENNRSQEAANHFEALSKRIDAAFGEKHPRSISTRQKWADALRNLERFTEAEKLDRQVLAESIEVLGADHAETATQRSKLATSLLALGRKLEAIEEFEKALASMMAIYQLRSPMLFLTAKKLAGVYEADANFSRAVELRQMVLEGVREHYGANSTQTIQAMRSLAGALRGAKQNDDAQAALLDALAIADSNSDITDDVRAALQGDLELMKPREDGVAVFQSGRHEEGLRILRENQKYVRKTFGPNSQKALQAGVSLIVALKAVGKHKEVAETAKQVLEDTKELLPPDQKTSLVIQQVLAEAYIQTGDWGAGLVAAERIVRIRTMNWPEEPEGYFAMGLLASCQLNQDQLDLARATASNAWDGLERTAANAKNAGTHRQRQAMVANLMIKIYQALEQPDNVSEWEEKKEAIP